MSVERDATQREKLRALSASKRSRDARHATLAATADRRHQVALAARQAVEDRPQSALDGFALFEPRFSGLEKLALRWRKSACGIAKTAQR